MIARIKGKIFSQEKNFLVIETSGGVGYEVHMTFSGISRHTIGQEIALYTYLKVSDSSQELYGFETKEEKFFFELLMTVSGVGPKSALNILSLGDMYEIQGAIARGDIKYLTGVQGMGKKTAERLVVELKTKVANLEPSKALSENSDNNILSDSIDGLVALGYTRENAKHVLKDIDTHGKSVEEILKQALKRIQ